MADFHGYVDQHHQGVDLHPLQNQTATIGDFNRIDLFYTNRSAFKLLLLKEMTLLYTLPIMILYLEESLEELLINHY